MYRILFVCTGNICRSPTAEGVLRQKLEDAGLHESTLVDSAGTQGYHVGEAPDVRSINAANKRGVKLADLRARQVRPSDFTDFDLILALDHSHLAQLQRIAPKNTKARLALFLEHAGTTQESEVPDPYYGGATGFEYVLDLIEQASDGLIAKLRAQLEQTHASRAAQGN